MFNLGWVAELVADAARRITFSDAARRATLTRRVGLLRRGAVGYLGTRSAGLLDTMLQVSILIGNTDNKLAQHRWAEFVAETQTHIERFATQVYFFGGPPNYQSDQNVCWVVDVSEERLDALKQGLRSIRSRFEQDSVALLVSHTEFV